LEDAVLEIIREHMFDPVKLRKCIEALKTGAEKDHEKISRRAQ
jgi:hypothetical protein